MDDEQRVLQEGDPQVGLLQLGIGELASSNLASPRSTSWELSAAENRRLEPRAVEVCSLHLSADQVHGREADPTEIEAPVAFLSAPVLGPPSQHSCNCFACSGGGQPMRVRSPTSHCR
jgi:hypothetical protein